MSDYNIDFIQYDINAIIT